MLYLSFEVFAHVMSYALTSELRSRLDYQGPSMTEVSATRTQLLLSNSHFVTHAPLPLMENVVQASTGEGRQQAHISA